MMTEEQISILRRAWATEKAMLVRDNAEMRKAWLALFNENNELKTKLANPSEVMLQNEALKAKIKELGKSQMRTVIDRQQITIARLTDEIQKLTQAQPAASCVPDDQATALIKAQAEEILRLKIVLEDYGVAKLVKRQEEEIAALNGRIEDLTEELQTVLDDAYGEDDDLEPVEVAEEC